MDDNRGNGRDQAMEQCETLCVMGFSALLAGDHERAEELFRRSVELDSDYVFGYLGLAKSRLPGAGYFEIIARIMALLQPARYVEIGIERGAVMRLLPSSCRVVGIDPEPRVEESGISALASIYLGTSDDFFTTEDLREWLGGPFDLAFIDGLHNFDQVLQDFINLERYAGSDAVILIHDTLPLDQQTSTPERKTVFWSGDVWKIIPCLTKERPDLRIFTIPTYPAGLSVVTGLCPDSRKLTNELPLLRERYRGFELGRIDSRKEFFSLVDNDWSEIEKSLVRVLEKGV